MKKKILIVIIIIFVSALAAAFIYRKSIQRYITLQTLPTDLDTGTGAAISSPNPDGLKQADLINALQKSLPLTTPGFVILNYDYSKGQFVVQNYYKDSNFQAEFETWYATSSYSGIPKSFFILQK